jgi:AP-4 complex subunit epsilon-1
MTTHGENMAQRRVGYLACTLCLHPKHELMLLLVGRLQNDLKSNNHLVVATALIVVTKLINVDTIPALLPSVVELLDHPQANVRKKAVMTLHRFATLSPESMEPHLDKAKRILCDKNPSVMGASLYLLGDLAEKSPGQFKESVPSFVSILKQITERRLPEGL